MNDILLAKPTLPPGVIDTSVGEPYVIREKLFEVFDMKDWKLPTIDHLWEYVNPQGYKPLIDLLEWKHNAPVVVTNGAKNALGATFYALKKMGKATIGMRSPYWALLPQLINIHGLEWTAAELGDGAHYDSYLCLSPNNPDGSLFSSEEIRKCTVPLIHDGAYHTHSYLPQGTPLPVIGDVQIYSLSKMLGLSSLRIGYAVCPNPEFYRLIKEYMEAMTVGVSLPSQIFAYELMNQMRGYPTLVEKFENNAFSALQEAKQLIKTVDPEVLEVPANFEENPGMFLWAKKGAACDLDKAKINAIDGKHFGVPGFVRMNLAFSKEKVQEIVNRLNASKE
jgi:aspartate/methionine/tyrosine aminotransferase